MTARWVRVIDKLWETQAALDYKDRKIQAQDQHIAGLRMMLDFASQSQAEARAIPAELLPTLIGLTHPDRHGNSRPRTRQRLATEATGGRAMNAFARTYAELAAFEVSDEIEPVVCGNCLFFRAGPDGTSCGADALVSRGLRDLSARTASYCQEWEAKPDSRPPTTPETRP